MKLRDLQASFAGGEISPALWGRVDLAKYKTALRTCRNFTTLPQGGVRNRPGTGYVAKAGDSTHAVRLIQFVASTTQAYIIELGNYYARFYTQGAQVQVASAPAWITATAYIVGNFVTSSSTTYYCLVAHTSGTFATDLQAGKWVAQTAYQIVTPWASADIFNLKFAQSADVMYFAHPSYAPSTITFNAGSSWTLAPFAFSNGPFMLQNTNINKTITPSGTTIGSGATKTISVLKVLSDGTIQLTTSTAHGFTTGEVINISSNLACTGTAAAYAVAVIAGGQFAANVVDATNFTLYQIGTTTPVKAGCPLDITNYVNNYYNTPYDTETNYFRILSSNAWAGTANTKMYWYYYGAYELDSAFTAAGQTSGSFTVSDYNYGMQLTITGSWTGTLTLQQSVDGVNWTTIQVFNSTILPETGAPSAGTAAGATLITLTASSPIFNAQQVGALFELVETITAQTVSQSFTSQGQNSASLKCGHNWSIITAGGWTGTLYVQVSIDGGVTWQTIQTLNSGGSDNYTTSGDSGFDQCLLRVYTPTGLWTSGTAAVTLSSLSFDWHGIVQIMAFTSSVSVSATILPFNNANTGLSSTNPMWQWSEGSWSTYRGWPTCPAFFQDRLHWASTTAEPLTGWASKTGSYLDYGTSDPAVASDSISFILQGRQLNAILSMVVMPQFMVVLTSDSEWGIGPGGDGTYSSTSFTQSLMGHRGSSQIDPAVVGVEILLLQQMGTAVRNLIYQLAVNGFMGDDISVASQHLFTGYDIVQIAYQQAPGSIVWAVRSDGVLLSCTYVREQELNSWNRHDTLNGLFESVAVIPNATLKLNEVWFVVNRGGTRYIEILKPRDQGTTPSAQWFVDCGTQYSGAPATSITGIPFPDGTAVTVLADGFMVANPNRPTDGEGALPAITVSGGAITLPIAASLVTVGLPITADVGLLDIESQNQSGPLQGRRVKQPRAKIRCWNSLGGFISTADPSAQTGIAGMDMLSDIMLRDPETHMDTPMPLVTGIVDVILPSGYEYGSHICIRQPDPFPFCLLDVVASVVPGGD